VLRDFGDVRAAIREFRLAARLARAAAEPDGEEDELTSLGTALVMAGRTEAGLAALDEALTLAASGAARGRILVRRGGSLHIAGRYAELGVAVPDAALDRCAVLLAAGLPADALASVEAALAGRITATKKAGWSFIALGA
jgi:hypothetical protein